MAISKNRRPFKLKIREILYTEKNITTTNIH